MSKRWMKYGSAILIATLIQQTRAEDVRLSIESDLVIHPTQISDVLQRAVDELNKKSSLSWERMELSVPLKTTIQNISTANQIVMAMDNLDAVHQTVNFAASWDDPGIDVARLDVDDKIRRVVNGINIVLNLKAACENISVRLPKAKWQISGTLKWIWDGPRPIFEMDSFHLSARPAELIADFGQCDTPPDLHEEMKKAITQMLMTESRLEEVFRLGLLRWVNGQFVNLEKELTEPREYLTANNLSVRWLPQAIGSTGGVVIVRGRLELARSGFGQGSLTVIERDNAMKNNHKITESGFVLPQASLKALTNFVYSSDLLSRRFSSLKVSALDGLFKSRLAQFFYWPDLMKFSTSSEFWFDLFPDGAPTLQQTEATPEGLNLKVRVPLALRMWEPEKDKYLPYINFNSRSEGGLELSVKKAKLQLTFKPEDLNLTYQFAPEYLALHPKASTYIRVSSFDKKLRKFLKAKSWEFQLPQISIPGNQQLGLGGIKMIEQGVFLRMDATPN